MTRRRIISDGLKGLGTMPHALIGYAGSTVRAAEMFHETYPEREASPCWRIISAAR